jgi:activating signal cointegrator complex subunit 1
MIQSLVSHLLVTQIFSAYFIGLSHSQAAEFLSIEKTLLSYGTTESLNTWRSTTLSIISKSSSHNKKIISETEAIISSIISQVNDIISNITIQDQNIPPESRDTSLRSLITSAITLSRLLRVQKAVFEIKMPVLEEHQQTMFDNERMEDIGGEDEESLNGREISCAVFPGVEKRGDENGERGHLVNIVSKVKVLCAPD